MEAFLGWITQYGSVIAFFVQVAYFIAVGVSAVWAVLLFKRLVEFQTGGPLPPARPAAVGEATFEDVRDKAAADAKKTDVSVDDFVD